MVKFKFDVKYSGEDFPLISKTVKSTTEKSVKVIAQDLVRASSGATPHKTGDLAGSYSIEYKFSGNKLEAVVEYAVYNAGFNYAIAMHEWTYKLGEGSKAKGGGKGMSGKTYKVGRKFLTRVLEGESETYTDYILQQIDKALR